jgi:hypothetical protein
MLGWGIRSRGSNPETLEKAVTTRAVTVVTVADGYDQ